MTRVPVKMIIVFLNYLLSDEVWAIWMSRDPKFKVYWPSLVSTPCSSTGNFVHTSGHQHLGLALDYLKD